MLEHTPGPWEFAEDVEHEAGWIVREVTNTTGDDYVAATQLAENARFIAAAPEMLQMLRTVRSYMRNQWGLEWEDMAQLIAKAEGSNE